MNTQNLAASDKQDIWGRHAAVTVILPRHRLSGGATEGQPRFFEPPQVGALPLRIAMAVGTLLAIGALALLAQGCATEPERVLSLDELEKIGKVGGDYYEPVAPAGQGEDDRGKRPSDDRGTPFPGEEHRRSAIPPSLEVGPGSNHCGDEGPGGAPGGCGDDLPGAGAPPAGSAGGADGTPLPGEGGGLPGASGEDKAAPPAPTCSDDSDCPAIAGGCLHRACMHSGGTALCVPVLLACQCLPGQPGACDDDNACTEDACNEAGACAFTPKDCSDGNDCTADSCNATKGCTHKAIDGGPCKDGSVCSLTSSCDQGSCEGDVFQDCDDGDPCTWDGCHPKQGCVHKPLKADKCDGAP